MKKITGLSLLAATLLATAPIALAEGPAQTFVFSVGNERYVAGSDVSVNQPVAGDLVTAGSTVTVNAAVAGSVQAAGSTVMLANTVGGNVRVFGGTVVIMKNVKGNIVVGGGTVQIQKGVEVGGSVLLLGGKATIDGNVTGNVETRGGSVILNGTVKGNTNLQGDSVTLNGRVLGNTILAARTLTVGPAAQMEKNLQYWQPTGERTFGSAVKGTVSFDPAFAMKEPTKETGVGVLAALITAITIYSILSGAVMIGLFLFITKTLLKDAAKMLKTQPGMSFLIGLLYFVLTPIAALLLLITIIGLPIAVAIALLFALSILFAKALSAIVFARYIEMQYKKKWNVWILFLVSLGIFLGLKLVGVLPIVGWIVTSVAILMGYGAVLRVKFERYKKIM